MGRCSVWRWDDTSHEINPLKNIKWVDIPAEHLEDYLVRGWQPAPIRVKWYEFPLEEPRTMLILGVKKRFLSLRENPKSLTEGDLAPREFTWALWEAVSRRDTLGSSAGEVYVYLHWKLPDIYLRVRALGETVEISTGFGPRTLYLTDIDLMRGSTVVEHWRRVPVQNTGWCYNSPVFRSFLLELWEEVHGIWTGDHSFPTTATGSSNEATKIFALYDSFRERARKIRKRKEALLVVRLQDGYDEKSFARFSLPLRGKWIPSLLEGLEEYFLRLGFSPGGENGLIEKVRVAPRSNIYFGVLRKVKFPDEVIRYFTLPEIQSLITRFLESSGGGSGAADPSSGGMGMETQSPRRPEGEQETPNTGSAASSKPTDRADEEGSSDGKSCEAPSESQGVRDSSPGGGGSGSIDPAQESDAESAEEILDLDGAESSEEPGHEDLATFLDLSDVRGAQEEGSYKTEEPNLEFGGVTYRFSLAPSPFMQRVRGILEKIVGGENDDGPRLHAPKFLERMKTFRLYPTPHKEEEGRSAVVFMPDVSGSCGHIAEHTLDIAAAMAHYGVAGAEVITVVHSNGVVLEVWIGKKKVFETGYYSGQDNDQSIDFLVKILRRYEVKLAIAAGDNDAWYLYARIFEEYIQPKGYKFLWLDHFRASWGKPTIMDARWRSNYGVLPGMVWIGGLSTEEDFIEALRRLIT